MVRSFLFFLASVLVFNSSAFGWETGSQSGEEDFQRMRRQQQNELNRQRTSLREQLLNLEISENEVLEWLRESAETPAEVQLTEDYKKALAPVQEIQHQVIEQLSESEKLRSH